VTLLAGVAGRPIRHSLSPLLHMAWIHAAGLDARFEAFEPVDEAAFRALVERGRAGELRGLNVTAPYKELALGVTDEASQIAAACGSVNLLVFENGRVRGDSTDGEGLIAALHGQAPGLEIAGQRVVVLGAGGAARAAVAALVAAGAEVAVVNRTRSRAEALTAGVGGVVAGPGALAEAALLVNAMSVPPEVDVAGLRDDAVLMDMTYRPLMTPFLQAGRARELTVVDGLAMLIGQARPSFRAFFGVEPPAIDVRRLALRALEEAA